MNRSELVSVVNAEPTARMAHSPGSGDGSERARGASASEPHRLRAVRGNMSDPAEGVDPAPDSVADEAFRRLYSAHGPVVLNYLIRLTGGDRHRAEDILQET